MTSKWKWFKGLPCNALPSRLRRLEFSLVCVCLAVVYRGVVGMRPCCASPAGSHMSCRVCRGVVEDCQYVGRVLAALLQRAGRVAVCRPCIGCALYVHVVVTAMCWPCGGRVHTK